MYMGLYVQGMLVHSNNDAIITNDAMSNNSYESIQFVHLMEYLSQNYFFKTILLLCI